MRKATQSLYRSVAVITALSLGVLAGCSGGGAAAPTMLSVPGQAAGTGTSSGTETPAATAGAGSATAAPTGAAPAGASATAAPGNVPTSRNPGVPKDVRILPKPADVAFDANGSFTLTASSRIVAPAAFTAQATYLAEQLRPATGFALPVATGAATAADVEFVAAEVPGDEAYTLKTALTGAKIGAKAASGAFYGAQTLLQMLPAKIAAATKQDAVWGVPAATISDQPRFGYRGVMLDVARSFVPAADVKAMIDDMARYKINTLHLHLGDDQAWRIEMKQPAAAQNPLGLDYTKLTEIGGKGGADYLYGTTLMGRELAHRGFYTQAEFKDLVAYAGSRQIQVIPEIDTPGHITAAVLSMPQLLCQDRGPLEAKSRGGEVGYSYLCAERPETQAFLTEVFKQLGELSPSPYVHFGGDEPISMIKNLGLKGYVAGVEQSLAAVRATGKTPMGWSEWANAEVRAGEVVQFWQDSDKSVTAAAAAKGAKVVMSPSARTYLDARYPEKTGVFGATWICEGGCPFENYYRWDPASYIKGVSEGSILGVEAPLWSERLRGQVDLEFMMYPRLLAVAEVAWSPQGERSFDEFKGAVAGQGSRLEAAGINYYRTPQVAW